MKSEDGGNPLKYWATEEPDRLAGEVMSRWREWRQYFISSGFAAMADKGRRTFYGLNDLYERSSRIQVGGDKAQFLKTVVNHIRVVVQRSLTLIAGQAPEMTPIAANSDADAREQAMSARGILEHVHREHNTDAIDDNVLKISMHSGEAFRLILWDSNKGEPTAVDPESGQPAATAGDFANYVLTPFQVARDAGARAWEAAPWVICQTWENKWELAARWPEKRDEILTVGKDNAYPGDEFDNRIGDPFRRRGDFVPVYRFFHLDGRALPGGRVYSCLNERTWLEDGPNPYECLPLERCTPDAVTDTTLGYSNVFDALGISDLLNALHSTFATNTTRWGVGTLVVGDSDNVQASTLANGTGILTAKRDPSGNLRMPMPMAVPQTTGEAYKYAADVQNLVTEALGMNATAMGNPPFSGMAAQAMMLLDQKAREYNDGLAKSFKSYRQGCATKELNILKKFATDPRMALIQGKAKQWMLKSYSSGSVSKVDRVAMEPTPAGTGSLAWRLGLIEALQGMGVQMPANAVLELLQTGQMESEFEYPEANRLRIKAENEGLLEGRMPPILVARTHWMDIPEHLALLSSPDMGEKPEVVEAVTQTVLQKLQAWRTMPKELAVLLGEPQELRAAIDAALMPPTMLPPGNGEPPPVSAGPAVPA